MTRLVLLALFAGGCVTAVRFEDRQVLWTDPDRDPIAKPAEQGLGDNYMRYRAAVFLPADRVLGIDEVSEAKNVNALDEVPDSTWWWDPRRAAAKQGRPFGPAEVGSAPFPGPDTSGPFTVVQGKGIGSSRGVVVKDAKGHKFIFKLDPPGYFGLSTATEVVASRLVRAAGWYVPSLTLLDVRTEDFVISPKATYKDDLGHKHPYTKKEFDAIFEGVPRAPDGRFRVSAGRWLEGEPVGSFSYVGRRADDPNDLFPHEDRRDLRAFGVFFAWINNVDCIEMQTFDSYVGEAGKGHLIHYQQDVGGSFGNYATAPLDIWMGHESYFHGWRVLGAFFSLGAWTRDWQRPEWNHARTRMIAEWPELGWFDADHFDPKGWSPVWRNPAIDRMTARDRYWGTKRVLAFSLEEIRAAVAAGQYRPETAQRLVEVLWGRRERIARAYLDEVAPLERFELGADELCFDDLYVQERLGGDAVDTYVARGGGPVRLEGGARRCAKLTSKPGYNVVEVRIRRAGGKHLGRPVRVHYVVEGNERRIVGIER